MRKRKNTMKSDITTIDTRADHRLIRASRVNGLLQRFGFIWIVVVSAAFLWTAESALGQYGRFTVSPMKIEAQITPGRQIQAVVNIQNLDPNSAYTFDLTLVELSQSKDGEWMIVDPNLVNDPNAPEFGFDLKRLNSCSSWVRLGSNTVTAQPSQLAPIEVTIRVPPRQRGFHTAGILAAIRSRPDITDMAVTVRFLIPVVVEVETRPMRPKIEATSVGLNFHPRGLNRPSTTMAIMGIENNGGTFSNYKPIVRIYAFSKNRWHIITTTELPEGRIIPGAILEREVDIQRSLPSGTYKVLGELYVDGRRTKPIERVFEFEGDPSVTAVRADAPLDLRPLDLTIDCSPGSLRSQTITVYNASDDAVHVQTASGLPYQLKQLVKGNLVGSDLDCTGWLEITPKNFTLPGRGGRQNVQVVAKLPAGAIHPCYYSLLALWATYPDGQKAGFKTANIFLNNNVVPMEPAVDGTSIRLQELSESKYLVTATFSNLKSVHFKPLSVRAGLIPTEGTGALTVPRTSVYLSGNPSPMLPFETRTFSGDLDLSNLPAGRYILTGRLEYAPGQIARPTRLIDISLQGDRRVVRTVGTQLELGGAVEVSW